MMVKICSPNKPNRVTYKATTYHERITHHNLLDGNDMASNHHPQTPNHIQTPQTPQPPNRSKALIWLPWVLLVAVLVAFLWYFITTQAHPWQSSTDWQPPREPLNNHPVAIANNPNNTSEQAYPNPADKVVSYHDAVAKAAQSVVNIYTTQHVSQNPYMADPILRHFFEFYGGSPNQEHNSTNLGSGVIVSEDGYIVTNAHVIEKADEIIVALNDGRKGRATVVGTDPESDLAVIRLDMTDLKPLAFREMPIQIGDVALAIGNPFGVGQTVTQGIISATGRTGLGVNTFEDFIQTDAAINPGNSGGALVDAYGQLIGINTMIFSRSGGSMGIGFAIPIALVEQVMNALIQNGKVSRGWLGIEVQSHIKDPTQLDTTTGVQVMNVVAGGPAAQAGLRAGDIILTIDDIEMTDANRLIQYVARKLPNTVLDVQVLRQGQTIRLPTTLAERPNQQELLSNSFTLPNQLPPQTLPQEPTDTDTLADNSDQGFSQGFSQGMGNQLSEAEREQMRQRLLELFSTQRPHWHIDPAFLPTL